VRGNVAVDAGSAGAAVEVEGVVLAPVAGPEGAGTEPDGAEVAGGDEVVVGAEVVVGDGDVWVVLEPELEPEPEPEPECEPPPSGSMYC
jgi:hypothetical protein